MMSNSESRTNVARSHYHTTNSKIQPLREGFNELSKSSVPLSTELGDTEDSTNDGAKLGKRRLFGFGRKKDDDKVKIKKHGEQKVPATNSSEAPTQVLPLTQRVPLCNGSPPRSCYTPSPQRHFSSSRHMSSPAGSQIFERDVQQSSIPMPSSPAIPSHITTENHIPPVLDASSETITNKEIDPDTVEIVTHSSHQPAVVTVVGLGGMDLSGNWAEEIVSQPDREDAASNYGVLDSGDIRRLSFISFSDIVQSGHAEYAGTRDSMYLAGLNSLSSYNRSPSPLRSPVSSQDFGTSPPTSKSASIKGIDMSPRGRSLGSPVSINPSFGSGELNIETMTQALRRTNSGDLNCTSGIKSRPLSPSSPSALSDKLFQ